jgi:hypothetical protein
MIEHGIHSALNRPNDTLGLAVLLVSIRCRDLMLDPSSYKVSREGST